MNMAGLIGKQVTAKPADGDAITGVVEKVFAKEGELMLLVNGMEIKLSEVVEISGTESVTL